MRQGIERTHKPNFYILDKINEKKLKYREFMVNTVMNL